MLESIQNQNPPEFEEFQGVGGLEKVYNSRHLLQENLASFNRMYNTIKTDLKSSEGHVEWENFVANFNAIFEKLAYENDELRMRLSCAQMSSRNNYNNQPSDRDRLAFHSKIPNSQTIINESLNRAEG